MRSMELEGIQPLPWPCYWGMHLFNEIKSTFRYPSRLDGHLISYGGMSKQPLKIPVGLQIFKNLTCHGYWHSRVWSSLSPSEQQRRLQRLIDWKEDGKLHDPLHEVVVLKGSDNEVNRTMKDALARLQAGMLGKKLLLKWDMP